MFDVWISLIRFSRTQRRFGESIKSFATYLIASRQHTALDTKILIGARELQKLWHEKNFYLRRNRCRHHFAIFNTLDSAEPKHQLFPVAVSSTSCLRIDLWMQHWNLIRQLRLLSRLLSFNFTFLLFLILIHDNLNLFYEFFCCLCGVKNFFYVFFSLFFIPKSNHPAIIHQSSACCGLFCVHFWFFFLIDNWTRNEFEVISHGHGNYEKEKLSSNGKIHSLLALDCRKIKKNFFSLSPLLALYAGIDFKTEEWAQTKKYY